MIAVAREIDLEKIGGQKLGPVSHARLDRALCRGRHEAGVQLDPDRPGAKAGRGDHGAAVTGAQVHDVVARTDLGHLQHGVYQDIRCRHPRYVLALLADDGSRLSACSQGCEEEAPEGQRRDTRSPPRPPADPDRPD